MIKLHVEVETPLTDDDRDILAGIAVTMLAVANRQNIDDQVQPSEDEPMPCGAQSEDDPTLFCVSDVAHKGRHKYRPVGGERFN